MKHLITILIAMTIISCSKQDDVASISTERKKPASLVVSSNGWNEIVVSGIDMHITADTNNCGVLVLHWDAQPSCNKYYIFDMNQPTSCWPSNTSTNVWYYQYGWGCNFNASSSVNAMVQGEYADSSTSTLYKYQSAITTIQTGRGQWNCN